MIENLKDRIHKFYNMGISTIPVKERAKVPAINTWTPFQNRLPVPLELYRMFAGWSWPGNYGVVCGRCHASNRRDQFLTVIDFDDIRIAGNWLDMGMPETYSVMTARGMHAYYFTRQETGQAHYEGLDVKGRGYVLGAGCIHPSGAVYHEFLNIPIATIDRIEDVLPGIAIRKQHNIDPGAAGAAYVPRVRALPVMDAWESAEAVGIDLIRKIKQRLNILDFFPGAEKTDIFGRFWIARCPFHDDHNPSFWIDAGRGLCGCFAGCTPKSLDVINLYARLHNVSDREAIRILGEQIRG